MQLCDSDQSLSCARSSFPQRLSPHRYTSSSCNILTPALPPTLCQIFPLSVAVITTTFFSVVSKLSALQIPACASQSAFSKVLPISSSPFWTRRSALHLLLQCVPHISSNTHRSHFIGSFHHYMLLFEARECDYFNVEKQLKDFVKKHQNTQSQLNFWYVNLPA